MDTKKKPRVPHRKPSRYFDACISRSCCSYDALPEVFFHLSPQTQDPARDSNSSWSLPDMPTVRNEGHGGLHPACLYLSRKLRRRIFQETVASQETSSRGSCNSCSVFLGLHFLKGKGNSVKNVKQGQRYKYILKALNKTCLKAVLSRDFAAPVQAV